jgi:hypothetical protein
METTMQSVKIYKQKKHCLNVFVEMHPLVLNHLRSVRDFWMFQKCLFIVGVRKSLLAHVNPKYLN